MPAAEILVLVAAGVGAGIASTLVSLASLVSYPVLLALGLSPVSANVTNTVALVFSAVGTVLGSRPELTGQGALVLRLSWLTGLGGAGGAALLLLSPADAFEFVAPVLIALAAVLLLVQPRIRRLAEERTSRRRPELAVALVGVAGYVGYFGAAGGVLMLAVLAPMLGQSMIRTIAIKNVISGTANGVAAVGFALFGPVDWSAVPPLAIGFLAGGWVGPSLARRIPDEALRYAVALCGLAVAAKLGWDTYR